MKKFYPLLITFLFSSCANLNGGAPEKQSIASMPASSKTHQEWLELGDSYNRQNRHVSAGEAYSKALELQPNHLPTHGAWCSSAVMLPDYDVAIEHCKIALADKGDYTAIFNLAQAYEGIWYLKGAKTYYQKYATDVGKKNPTDEFVLLSLGKLSNWTGKVRPGQDEPFTAEEKAQFEQYREHLFKIYPSKLTAEGTNQINTMVYVEKNRLRAETRSNRAPEIAKLLMSDPWNYMR